MLVKSSDYSRYMTYNELLNNCRIKNFGKELLLGYSKEKREIIGFLIGNGNRKAIIYGQPHAEELVGTLTINYLLEELEFHKNLLEKWTIMLIPTIDPDGLIRNNGWVTKPFDPELFILNHYHRPDEQDIDWTFPIKTKYYSYNRPTKETKILMKLIQELNPDFYASLHNIHFAAAHFYSTEANEELFNIITDFIENQTDIPLQRGETFFADKKWQYRDGFYKVYGTINQVEEIKDKETLKDFRRGECGPLYYKSKVPKGFAFIPEVPMLYSDMLKNVERTDKTVKETQIRSSEILLEAVELIIDYWQNWKKKFNKKHYQYKKIKEIVLTWRDEILSEIRDIRATGEDRVALKNEVYSNEIIVRYNNCLILGQLYQLVEDSEKIPIVQREQIKNELISKIRKIINETMKNGRVKVADINTLVAIQAFSIIAALNLQ